MELLRSEPVALQLLVQTLVLHLQLRDQGQVVLDALLQVLQILSQLDNLGPLFRVVRPQLLVLESQTHDLHLFPLQFLLESLLVGKAFLDSFQVIIVVESLVQVQRWYLWLLLILLFVPLLTG